LTRVINIVGNCRQDADKRLARNPDRRAIQPNRAPALDYRSLAMSQMSVPVEKFTTRNPVTANAEAMIDELRQLMVEHNIRHLPIVRGTSIVGVVSDRDLRVVAGLTLAEKMQVRADDIMSVDPVMVAASTPLDEVARIMADRKVGSVIVNEDSGGLMGIFTVSDALDALIAIIHKGGAAAS
jgi:acetoin utilization protein AcuB